MYFFATTHHENSANIHANIAKWVNDDDDRVEDEEEEENPDHKKAKQVAHFGGHIVIEE